MPYEPAESAAPRNVPVGVRLARSLGEAILGGTYQPGDALPGELELAQKYGVSRTLIREALKSLAAKGLIESRKKAGTRVRPRSEWQLFDPHVLAWRLETGAEEKLALDLLQMRAALEPAAAAAAARSQNAPAIDAIAAAFEQMELTAHDRSEFAEPDLRFHKAILAASGNEFMVAFGSIIEAALRAFLGLSMRHPGAPAPSVPLHGEVLKAITAGDAAGAEKAMHALLDRTRKNITNRPDQKAS